MDFEVFTKCNQPPKTPVSSTSMVLAFATIVGNMSFHLFCNISNIDFHLKPACRL